jgi:molecular chaperone HtpG
MSEHAETHVFETETRKILDLVVKSLYSDRAVFLRELISNASDALDRARYAALHREDLRAPDGELRIEILVDEEARTLTIRDNGIGMTREQAKVQLGTIAHSGTRAFLQAAEDGDGVEGLIGQFGVGFYAAFMVSDRIVVETLSAEPDAEPVRWETACDDSYSLAPGGRETRGTDVVLTLKEDELEFLQGWRIAELVRRYSDFVSFPIRQGEEQLNRGKALWTATASEVSDEDYDDFYKHVSGDWSDPLARVHFTSDAPMQFHALLFVPGARPMDMDYPDGRVGVRLYSKRVMILEEARDLLPRYLRFLRGVVESDDLDLNVSRELLQQTPQAASLRKQVVKRVLRKLDELARTEPETYERFWKTFGSALKEGVHEDVGNRERLAKLLRYPTTAGDSLRSLQQVVDAMPEDQEHIWYLTGLQLERMKKSPLLERFRKKGQEVLLMDDPVDEWVVLHLSEFAGKELKSVARGEVDEPEEQDDPIAQAAREQAKPLLEHITELLAGEVKEVRASGRLTDSPSVLVDDEAGLGSNLAKILRSANQEVPASQRILEINAEHPIVKNLARMHEQGRAAAVEPLAWLLLDHARLAEGEIKDPAAMVGRLQKVMLQATLPSHVDLGLTPPVEPPLPEGTAPLPEEGSEAEGIEPELVEPDPVPEA